ncbi:XPG domain containing-domain-containing protein [Chytriomyces sp. MP71]|nr:XPG domain containing-domain-containing protein [Chytriomyces sp. MP71]
MGVRGLSAFLRDQGGAMPVQFSPASASDTNLIVDGNSLVHHIYKPSQLSPPALATSILSFAQSLCATFRLTIVFDGPLPRWKFAQRLSREGDKLEKVSANLTQEILSPLSLIACIQTLCFNQNKFGFTVVVAEGEADLTITSLARQQNAFVSSYDSDFFIHVCRGYLPLDGISFQPDGIVAAQVWTFQQVATQLNLAPELLPILAYAAGCDYTLDEKQWTNVNIRLGSNSGAWSKRIRTIAAHLRRAGPLADAIESLVPNSFDDRDAILSEVKTIVDIFRGEISVSGSVSYASLPSSAPFPFETTIQSGFKSHKFVEMQNGSFWCQSIIEDLSRSPAWEASRPIRRRLYSLLNIGSVGEYMRRAMAFRVEHVTAIPLEGTPRTPLSIYNCVMGNLVPDTLDLQPMLPLILSLKFLAEAWKETPFQLKNFEVVAVICMAVKSLSERSKAVVPLQVMTSPLSPLPAIARSKPVTHLLACLETILFSSWLAWQAAFNESSPESLEVEHAHWKLFDTSTFNHFLTQAKTGRGPQFLLSEAQLADFTTVWEAVNVGDCILEIVDYGGGKNPANAGGPMRRKKKRDVGSTVGKKSKKSSECDNFFSVLGNE